MDHAGIQLTLTVAPAQQYQPSPMLNIQGDNYEQFSELMKEALKSDSLEPFFTSYAMSTAKGAVAAVTETFQAQPVGTPAPAPVRSLEEGATCPNCNSGTLVKKTRKDGKGTFIGCDAYPACNYIVKGR